METVDQSTVRRADARDPLVVERLTKTYPGPVDAVRSISFSGARGEIFGLLGPNGAPTVNSASQTKGKN